MRPIRLLVLLSPLLALGCSEQDNEKIRELSQLEGGAQAEAQIERDREAARPLEEELSALFDFYEAASGRFEGWMSSGSARFRIRIALYPNRPRYRGTRRRSQEEVRADLGALSLNAQVSQWNPQVPASGIGCRVEGLRPDASAGTLNIISSSCPSSYFLVLSPDAIAGAAEPSTGIVFDIQAERIP